MPRLRHPTGSPVVDDERVEILSESSSSSKALDQRLAEITLKSKEEAPEGADSDSMEVDGPSLMQEGTDCPPSDPNEAAIKILMSDPALSSEQKLAAALTLMEKQKRSAVKLDLRVQHLERMLHSVARREVNAKTATEERNSVRANERYVEALINKIPKFSGTVDETYLHRLQAFNNACKAFVSGSNLTDAQKLAVITGQFDDLAASWWHSLVAQHFDSDSARACKSLKIHELMAKFLEHFTPANMEIEICEALQLMRQGREVITTFISRFKSMASLSRVMHPSTKAYFFLSALSPNLAQMVKVQCADHCDFEQLCEVANRIRKSTVAGDPQLSAHQGTQRGVSAALLVSGGAHYGNEGQKSRVQCHACNGFGHIRRDCPNDKNTTPTGKYAGVGVGKRQAHPAMRRMQRKQPERYNPQVCYTEEESSLACEPDSNIVDFVIDSGAGRHLIAASSRTLDCNVNGAGADNCILSSRREPDNKSSAIVDSDFISPLIDVPLGKRRVGAIAGGNCRAHTAQKRLALESKHHPMSEKVILADGKIMQATSVGDVPATVVASNMLGGEKQINLKRSLVVPELKFNLFSVPAANKDGTDVHFWQDGSVTFDRNGCEIVRTDPTDECVRTLKMRLYANSVRRNPYTSEGSHGAFVAQIPEKAFILLHEALGHPSLKKMKLMLASGELKIGDVQFPDVLRCDVCQQSKQTRRVKGSGGTKYPLLEVVHSDLCEMSAASMGGARYMLTFMDDHSRFCKLFLIPNKEADTVTSKFGEFVSWAERVTNSKVLRLRSDHGSEYENVLMKAFCTKSGITQEFSNAYSPSQNGNAERINRSLLEIMRANMIQSRLPGILWAEVMMYSCHLYNYRPHSANNGATPASRFFGKEDSRRVFKHDSCHPVGCAVHVTIPPVRRSKLQPKTVKGWYLGVGINEPGVRVWLPETNEIYTSAHIVVWREQRYAPREMSDSLVPVVIEDPNCEWEIDCIVDERTVRGKREFRVHWKGFPSPSDDTWQSYGSVADTVALDKWEGLCAEPVHACLASAENIAPTVRQALQSKDHAKWWDAMCREYDAINEQGTWEVVPRPVNRKVVGVTWVLRTKSDVQSGHTIHKARLCARGFTQIPGVDFDATYAPTVSRAGLRLTVAIAVQLGMLIHAVDCKNAFLNGTIDKEIYLEQPPYFLQTGTTSGSHVCKLRKALYGLKQSPLIWNQALHSALEAAGFKRMEYEPCLYVHRSRGGVIPGGASIELSDTFGDATKDPMFIIIAVYVDDLTIAAMTQEGLDLAKSSISSVFKIKDEGEVKRVIGIEFEKLSNGYILHQREYMNQVLCRYGLQEANGVAIPMDQGTRLFSKLEMEPCTDSTQYRSQVGAILFAATCTRPDLCVSTNICARYVENPCQRHCGAVKRIMRYIKGTLNYGLEFRRNGKPIEITAYCDSDFAGDVGDSKSTSGYVVLVNGCAVSWKTTKQKSISTSTVEAEYVAASTACKEVMWLRWLMEEILGTRLQKPVVWIDNNGARLLAENDQLSEKTKHIRYSYHFVRECVKDGIVELRHISTHENVADMMTKPLNRVLLERHRAGLKLMKF